MKRKIGLLLCGAGAVDGTDPHEAVLIQTGVLKRGHQLICLALNQAQLQVADHTTTAEVPDEARNQFVESARLVRGKLFALEEISPRILDILIIPGGQGVVKSLLHGFSLEGPRSFAPGLREFLMGVHDHGGMLGFMSLAEFLGTELLGPWPEDRGCFDLAPEEVLLDAEKGRALSPGNLSCANLAQLDAGVNAFLDALILLAEGRLCNGPSEPSISPK